MAEPVYVGSFRKAIFRLGDEPDSPVLLKTFLGVTPIQGMYVTVKNMSESETRYVVQDVTMALEEKSTGGEDAQLYYEPTVYVDLALV